jgi:hypothetical protein
VLKDHARPTPSTIRRVLAGRLACHAETLSSVPVDARRHGMIDERRLKVTV